MTEDAPAGREDEKDPAAAEEGKTMMRRGSFIFGMTALAVLIIAAAPPGEGIAAGPRAPAETDYLIWEPDPLPGSGQALLEALYANGASALITTELMAHNLEDFLGLFVCLGIYPHNFLVPEWSPEAIAIEEYLDIGGRVYIEGGDCWYWDPLVGGHDFGPSFGIIGIDDGSEDLSFLEGIAGTFTEGLTFEYVGENGYMDHLATQNPSSYGNFRLFINPLDLATHGVAFLNGVDGSRTLGVSFEFGGLEDVSSFTASNPNELMARYLTWFYPPDTAYIRMVEVSTDTSEYSPGDSLYLDVKWEYVNAINSLQWDFTVIGALARDTTNYQPRLIDTHLMESVGPGTHTRHIGFKVPAGAPIGTPGVSFGRVIPTAPFQAYKVEMFGDPFWVGEALDCWEYYDDGTYENSIASPNPEFGVATRFTPLHYPATVESISCRIDGYDNMYNSADLYVYADSGGLPDTVLAGPYTIQATTPPERIVVATNVSITSGDYHVGLIWTDAGGYGPYISSDQDAPAATGRQSWKDTSGWVQLSTLGSPFDDFDLSFRAHMDYTTSNGVREQEAD